MSAEAVVHRFIDVMNTLDWDAVYDMMTDDVFVQNMPLPPMNGLHAVRAFYDGIGPAISDCDWRINHIATSGNTVLTERIDDFKLDGKSISLPVMGTFEIEAGKIKLWRDYFDLKTFEAQLGRPLLPQ
ncbi:MAG: limonene-1,2-epoxide hydrolase family protein [Pseudomonadota bacterium]